jgi:hypothetical protein
MSDPIIDKALSYAEATGLLTVIVDQLLVVNLMDKKTCASVFVKTVEQYENMPESVIRLKDEVKQKYNL